MHKQMIEEIKQKKQIFNSGNKKKEGPLVEWIGGVKEVAADKIKIHEEQKRQDSKIN